MVARWPPIVTHGHERGRDGTFCVLGGFLARIKACLSALQLDIGNIVQHVNKRRACNSRHDDARPLIPWRGKVSRGN